MVNGLDKSDTILKDTIRRHSERTSEPTHRCVSCEFVVCECGAANAGDECAVFGACTDNDGKAGDNGASRSIADVSFGLMYRALVLRLLRHAPTGQRFCCHLP